MGGKTRVTNFSRNQPIERVKMLGKNCRKNVRINVFSIHTNIVSKKRGEKTRETIFPETQQIVRTKYVRKKSSGKSAKKSFLYLHEYRDLKWGKNPRNNFYRNKPIVTAKKCWDKNRRKKLRKNFFYIHTNIVTKKTPETIFPETHQ